MGTRDAEHVDGAVAAAGIDLEPWVLERTEGIMRPAVAVEGPTRGGMPTDWVGRLGSRAEARRSGRE
ncbi:MAG TPA: hypothetical protein VMD28_07450 [Acidimicrobiales bacterium]|nr:hypothetical protein [Acidimicrobiales bacterium]